MKRLIKRFLPLVAILVMASSQTHAGLTANTALGIFQGVIVGPGIATFAGLGATEVGNAINYLEAMPQTNLRGYEVDRLKGARGDYWFGVAAGIAESLLGFGQIAMEHLKYSPKWLIGGEVASLAVIIASLISNGIAIGTVSNACDNNRCSLTDDQLAEFKDTTKDIAYSGWDGATLITVRLVGGVLDLVSLSMQTKALIKHLRKAPAANAEAPATQPTSGRSTEL